MLLELVVVAVAAATIGATLALVWAEKRGRRRPRWTARDTPPEQTPWNSDPPTWPPQASESGFDMDHQPGLGLLHVPGVPSVPTTPHPLKPHWDGPCLKDAIPFCVDGVEYRGSCEIASRDIPRSRVRRGACRGPALRTWTDA